MPLLSVKSHYQKVKAFYQRYEKFFMPALIIWGFIYHYITFKIIPIKEVLYLVFAYLILATATILFVHLYDAGKISQRLRYIRLFIPLLLQFTLSSIIGGVFIFYWFSGSIFVSWPFIVIVIILIISIEAFKQHLEKPAIQFSLYYFASILLLAVAFPYFFNSLSAWMFIAAGITSFLLVLILAQLLSRYSEQIRNSKIKILAFSLLIFFATGLFYFFNLIPPVPLSIREAGIYHSVRRSGSGYVLEAEPQSFWQKMSLNPTIHLAPGEQAFVYTSIYTPTDLRTDIVHDWQYYDETKQGWVEASKLSFAVTGGRQDGYRGYSLKTNLAAGKWRVFVETPRGQVLGRIKFNVERVAEQPNLEQIKK
jgi:hypothetical protein